MLIVEISGCDQWHVDSRAGQRGGFCIILHRQLPPLASRKADSGHVWLQAKLLPTSIQAWEKEVGESIRCGSKMQNQHICLKALTFLFCIALLFCLFITFLRKSQIFSLLPFDKLFSRKELKSHLYSSVND